MQLSLTEARRIALAAQGFGRRPSSGPRTLGELRTLTSRAVSLQLDSVNVLVRSHYLPAYSRIGPYARTALDRLAYDRRELFETWTHASCLVPVDLYPLFRYRTGPIRAMPEIGWPEDRARSSRAEIRALYDEVAERGPIAANELSTAAGRTSQWWGWDRAKILLEWLLDCGIFAVAGRREFTRLYDLTERVVPQAILDTSAPSREDAQKELLCRSARALGVGTARDIARFLGLQNGSHRTLVRGPDGRWPKRIWSRLMPELVAEGRLQPVEVEGWSEPGYVVPGTRVPRALHARALLTPFDSFVRCSAASLCGFTNPLAQQLYVPAARRQYGYYVLPFLLGDTLVGRCDLKADRVRRALQVRSSWAEPGQDQAYVSTELFEELQRLRDWLELDTLEIAEVGNLAAALRRRAGAG